MEFNHQAKKRFGQNFLIDDWVIERIVSCINPASEDHLIEIGPGQGALTKKLLGRCQQLDVIELDRELTPPLEKLTETHPSLTIYQSDALSFDFSTLFSTATDHSDRMRLLGNLPYNISTPLIFHVLDQKAYFRDMHFMLQKEVVDRMVAIPNNKSYGRLSVMVQYHCRVESLFDVGPECFRPPPKVFSSFARLTPYTHPPINVNHSDFEQIVKVAFSHRRKTLKNNLKGLLDESAIKQANIDPNSRAEQLGLEEFAQLSRLVGS